MKTKTTEYLFRWFKHPNIFPTLIFNAKNRELRLVSEILLYPLRIKGARERNFRKADPKGPSFRMKLPERKIWKGPRGETCRFLNIKFEWNPEARDSVIPWRDADRYYKYWIQAQFLPLCFVPFTSVNRCRGTESIAAIISFRKFLKRSITYQVMYSLNIPKYL